MKISSKLLASNSCELEALKTKVKSLQKARSDLDSMIASYLKAIKESKKYLKEVYNESKYQK